MSTTNTVEGSKSPETTSSRTFHVAGILTTVWGLDELPKTCKSISCLWLLHGRLRKKEFMSTIANTCVQAWNQAPPAADHKVGLIAVAIDQRNHGTREVHPLANQGWKERNGEANQTHAQDMYSILHGTATDVSLLIDHLGSYIFHDSNAPSIDQHLVLGISLGGHAAWQMFFSEPRITAAIVIIGCPDYMNLMEDRAQRSKLNLQNSTSKSGQFLGSTYFPNALVESMKLYDPKGLLFGTSPVIQSPSTTEQSRIRPIFDAKIKGKKLLICSGGADKLVPYHCGKDFLKFFKAATQEGGWYADGHVYVEDNVYPGIGHAYSDGMVNDTTRFVCDVLARGSGARTGPSAQI